MKLLLKMLLTTLITIIVLFISLCISIKSADFHVDDIGLDSFVFFEEIEKISKK